jgi:multimeric flavodoxin WrbA
LNSLSIKGCQACGQCREKESCAVQDDMQLLYAELEGSDAIVIGSPVYFGQVTAQTKAFLDRFYALMGPEGSKLRGKKLALVYAQGNPNAQSFQPYFDIAERGYGFLGLKLKGTLLTTGSSGPGTKDREDLLERAKQIGARLF